MIFLYFVVYIYYWGDIYIKNFGEDRVFKISLFKIIIEKGLIYIFYQDILVIVFNMLEIVWCVVNRIIKKGI